MSARTCGSCASFRPYGPQWPGAGLCGVPTKIMPATVASLTEVGRVRFAARPCSLPQGMRRGRSK